MYRKIFDAVSEEDLTVQLPKEYLNKKVEIIAFELANEKISVPDEVNDFSDAETFFEACNASPRMIRICV